MRIDVLAMGNRTPGWVETGSRDFLKRLPPELAPQFRGLPLARRGKTQSAAAAVQREGEQMLKLLDSRQWVVALDRRGQSWSTEQFAEQLDQWRLAARPVALLVGGPEGLSPACLERADQRWSLSPLTLPHPLVRVVLAEQFYRAWALLNGHPYHK